MNLGWFGVPPLGGSNDLDRLKPGLQTGDVPRTSSWSQCMRKNERGLSMNRKVEQASRLPRRRSRPHAYHAARAGALAGQAGRLPYVSPLRFMVPMHAEPRTLPSAGLLDSDAASD